MNLDFCPNKKSKEFLEMSSIFGEDKAYFLWMRNKGNHLEKAPNGADSKLFQDLLEYFKGNRTEALKAKAKTYKNEFINWFGDWTKGLSILQDDKSYYRGQYEEPIIDKDGNLILRGRKDSLYNEADYNIEKGVSATTDMESANEYGSNQRYAYEADVEDKYGDLDQSWEKEQELNEVAEHGYYLIQFPKNIPNQIIKEAGEVKIVGDVVIPKGQYVIEHISDDGGGLIATADNNASKVVDENGEPLVVYHGNRTDNKIKSFDLSKKGSEHREREISGFWFVNSERIATNEYALKPESWGTGNPKFGETLGVFLNIKNPVIAEQDIKEEMSPYGLMQFSKEKDFIHKAKLRQTSSTDGFILTMLDSDGDNVFEQSKQIQFVAFNPNQIKSATGNSGDFSLKDDNIYHNLPLLDAREDAIQDLIEAGLIGVLHNNTGYYITTPNESTIHNILNKYGLTYDKFKLKSGRTKIYIRSKESSTKNLPDKIARLKSRQEIFIENFSISELSKEDATRNEIIKFLQEKFPQLEVHYITSKDLTTDPAYKDVLSNTNSFVVGNKVFIVEDRVNSEIAIEEMLHPLVYTIANQNWDLFQQFVKEAKKEFPRLANEIESRYTDKLGFSEQTRQFELVTLVLSRYVNKKYRSGEKGNKLSTLIDKFFNYIGSLVSKFVGKFTGKDNDFNNIKRMSMSELADIILAEDSKFHVYTTAEIQHSISSRQLAAQDEATRLITRMNVLYRLYERIKDKTPSQERLTNLVFETLNKLKQHRNITAVLIALDQAKLTLGQYDPSTGMPVQVSSIFKYLYEAQQNDFAGVSIKSLVDMYRNSIKFYKDLIDNIPSEQVIDLSLEDKRLIADLKSLIDNHIMPIWTSAIMQVGDQIVDDQIDSEVFSSTENKEDMKKVAKDWLHKNLMYGDINAVTSYVYNYSNSSNPIIKQAFHLILEAEQKTQEEIHRIAPKLIRAYQKANSGLRSMTPGWQSIMMEYDKDGIPTGNFVRDINYGQYLKDLKEFLTELNDRFIAKYGFTYVTDDTGAITNSLTGEFAEDEEWGPNGEMPKYIEYLREIESWKKHRVHRLYTSEYYLARLSRPYDGTIDPLSSEFKDTRFNHGLSPKTLSRYTYYQSNINFYLNKCQDLQTGMVYPERLSYDDQKSLDSWKERMEKFVSLFNTDGSYKSGEELKMAYEVRAWLKFTGEYASSVVDQDLFNAELARVKQEAASQNNPRIYDDFVRYNSHAGINPDYILQTIGDFKSDSSDTDTSFRGKLMRASLQQMVNNPRIFGRELRKMINNPLFWLLCKMSDQAIEDARDPDNSSGWSPDKVHKFQNSFYLKDILYVNEYGYYIDENGNAIDPNDPNAKQLEDAGKLLTFRGYLINIYTDEALRTGQVSGLIDENTGNPIDFSGLNQSDIRNSIATLLSFRKKHWDEDGTITEKYEPLSIFSVLSPTEDTFFNKRTKRTEPTIIIVGDSRFKKSNSWLLDDLYDKNSGIAEIPDKQYDSGRYNNEDAYNKVMKDANVSNLYDLLIQTMKDAQDIYSTNRKFNYKIPQINAHTAALFSRVLRRGYSAKAIQGLWNSITQIEENDELLRTKQDYFIGVDGEIANDVPLKFIRELKNKEDLSTDLVSSVIMFADMAINYKNKSEIDSKLRVLRYNMDKSIREIYESKLMPKTEQAAKDNSNSTTMFDSMMDVSMYGNKFGKTNEGGPSKTRVALHKTADTFQSLESSAMLGLNMFSMAVGFGDSITRIFSESIAGKYMTVGDCLWALGKVLWYTPACIKNMFNPLANNKMTALMLMNGISKGTFGIYTKTDWGKGRKFLSNVLMGGWSMLDWMANALLMTAFYHNVHLYEGDVIPKGFYTKYELQQAFINAGKTKAEANAVHNNFGNLGHRVTLWDAYYFHNGEVHIKSIYELYVTQRVKTNLATKTKKRGALYNGMNPDNDVPRWKRDVIGRLAGALRGWIVQLFQHLVAGGTDNVAIGFETEDIIETNTSGTRKKQRTKKISLTDEQRNRRMAWDYETGTPQDQILVGLWRSFKTLYKMANQTLLCKPKTAKLSEIEKYAWKDTIIFAAMLAMMMVGWTYIHDDARDVKKPTTREEAGPMSMLNPADYHRYIKDVYIPNQYWKLGVDDIYFRIIESKISNINPQQVLDIVNALTALKSGLDDQIGIVGLGLDVLNGENTDEVLKLGAYKFYTKGERLLYRAVGPAKNLHTFLTYYGATNNLRWYTNKFGKVYRAFGYDFKQKDKDTSKQNNLYSGGFEGGDFEGGNFEGGDFEGGNFE